MGPISSTLVELEVTCVYIMSVSVTYLFILKVNRFQDSGHIPGIVCLCYEYKL